jgi:hypothetical protein
MILKILRPSAFNSGFQNETSIENSNRIFILSRRAVLGLRISGAAPRVKIASSFDTLPGIRLIDDEILRTDGKIPSLENSDDPRIGWLPRRRAITSRC